MELSINQTNNTKGIAILMMVCLHLFNQPYEGLFEPVIFIGKLPLTYYISLFCDCCVAIYCFCSGYGLFIGFSKKDSNYNKKNYIRILKIYINYWIVLLLFAVVLGVVLGRTAEYPGSISTFLLNVSAINTSYNGAWWFITTYILLVLSSPYLFKIIDRLDYRILLVFTFLIYIIGYIQRIKTVLQFDNAFLDYFIKQIALYFNSVFPFLIGAIANKQKWYTSFSTFMLKFRYCNLFLLSIILIEVILHGIFPALFFAVFTGVLFVFCFNCLKLPFFFNKIFSFLSQHSMNIWLIHMFFYLIFFRDMIYYPKNPILIYLWLLLWSIMCSFIVNLIYTTILIRVDKYFKH
ncbi:acyltransferase [Flavobacterium sp. SUN046]|uniref:acyltransferase family protein n=1 Tax=Flavobacterium sp. SUN046 TaxID=3002440 RepID=UPI002DBC81DA|nr:acyltransferase [Flavobacterium sp. SUN046]MEC4050882.1 acyltransferase [Flavobacterium sp. SUN046]